jgi:hypothetical protein
MCAATGQDRTLRCRLRESPRHWHHTTMFARARFAKWSDELYLSLSLSRRVTSNLPSTGSYHGVKNHLLATHTNKTGNRVKSHPGTARESCCTEGPTMFLMAGSSRTAVAAFAPRIPVNDFHLSGTSSRRGESSTALALAMLSPLYLSAPSAVARAASILRAAGPLLRGASGAKTAATAEVHAVDAFVAGWATMVAAGMFYLGQSVRVPSFD